MFERTLRFITENSDELATIDPFYLPQVCLSIMQEHKAWFITVYAPDNGMKTIFVAHYNAETKYDTLQDRYTYCYFDGSKNEHLKRY